MSEKLNFNKALNITPKQTSSIVIEEAPIAPAAVEPVKKEVKAKTTKVVKIVQRTPSGFRLLLENGEIRRVHKSAYKPGQEFIDL